MFDQDMPGRRTPPPRHPLRSSVDIPTPEGGVDAQRHSTVKSTTYTHIMLETSGPNQGVVEWLLLLLLLLPLRLLAVLLSLLLLPLPISMHSHLALPLR